MYAVVRSGGKQIRVEAGDTVDLERLPGAPGDQVQLDEVLLVGGESLVIGTPTVEGAVVKATIRGESAGPKLRVFKLKRRKGYRLHRGHRQHYTRVKIDSIEVS